MKVLMVLLIAGVLLHLCRAGNDTNGGGTGGNDTSAGNGTLTTTSLQA